MPSVLFGFSWVHIQLPQKAQGIYNFAFLFRTSFFVFVLDTADIFRTISLPSKPFYHIFCAEKKTSLVIGLLCGSPNSKLTYKNMNLVSLAVKKSTT